MAELKEISDAKNRRCHSRQPVRTVATVISVDEASATVRPLVYKAWTEDISASGAAIASEQEIVSDRVWIRMLLPELKDKLVECVIIRTKHREGDGILQRGPQFVYGVRFERILTNEEFDKLCEEAGTVIEA